MVAGDARRCYPSDVSDAAWAVIAPLMPVRDQCKGDTPRRYGDRLVLDANLGRRLPVVRHLAPDGTWHRIHEALRGRVRISEGRAPQPSAAILDSQSMLTSEGGPHRGFDMGKKTRGRKRHLVVDTQGLVLMVTSAAVQDHAGGKTILARLATCFPTVGLV
jgi:transposase